MGIKIPLLLPALPKYGQDRLLLRIILRPVKRLVLPTTVLNLKPKPPQPQPNRKALRLCHNLPEPKKVRRMRLQPRLLRNKARKALLVATEQLLLT